MDEDEDTPYSERDDWKDVTPIPQDDGPKPLAVIRYPPGFEEVHGYFRAIQKKDETSQRALKLTAAVIEQNSANYTAWYYRRKCLKELAIELDDERIFTDKWARECPKNYQVWYHRRWLISEIAGRIRAAAGEQAEQAEAAEAAEAQIQTMAKEELRYHLECMQVNNDYKNYNGWSHRQFILQHFKLWHEELPFVEQLLRDDIRNNSAWNHRYTVVRNQSWPLTDAVRTREINFAMDAIRQCANNECAWNYLSAFLGEGDGKVSWTSVPEVEALCCEVLEVAKQQNDHCRFAAQALADIYEAKEEVPAALGQYEHLQEIDRIREKFWRWKADILRQKKS